MITLHQVVDHSLLIEDQFSEVLSYGKAILEYFIFSLELFDPVHVDSLHICLGKLDCPLVHLGLQLGQNVDEDVQKLDV